MKELYNKVLDAVSIDPRLETGIFDVLNNDHLTIFREHLIKEGGTLEMAIAASNKLAEAGRFPERQAYNKDGLLVTFPSPEHKKRALARGSHFETNPKTAQTNIFGADVQQAPQASTNTQNPVPSPAPAVAPAQAPAQAPAPATNSKTPEQEKNSEPVNVDNRTPEERNQDAAAIEKMLKTEYKVYTLAEAISFGFYSKDNVWYSSEGKRIGKLWYNVDRKEQVILP